MNSQASLMRLIFSSIIFIGIMFAKQEASLTTKLQETKKPILISPSLFNSKNEKTQRTTSSSHGQQVFKHLEEHINSLKQLTNQVHDHKSHIMHVPLLFACLENDSTYENCDKINSFIISDQNSFSCREKHIKIQIHIQIRHCNNEKIEVLYNTTLELFLTIEREITSVQELFEDGKCTFFRIYRVSESLSLIVFNNQLYQVNSNTVENKLNELTWGYSYFLWYQFKYKYYNQNKESCIYFDFWTYFSIFRDLSWFVTTMIIIIVVISQTVCCVRDLRRDWLTRYPSAAALQVNEIQNIATAKKIKKRN